MTGAHIAPSCSGCQPSGRADSPRSDDEAVPSLAVPLLAGAEVGCGGGLGPERDPGIRAFVTLWRHTVLYHARIIVYYIIFDYILYYTIVSIL